MTQEEIIKLLCNDDYKYKVINLGNNKRQITLEPKHINCAMCNETIKTEEGITKQDRRIIGLVVDKKYCKECANEIDDILSNIKTTYKEPLGKSF